MVRTNTQRYEYKGTPQRKKKITLPKQVSFLIRHHLCEYIQFKAPENKKEATPAEASPTSTIVQ
jgi:hypothetical protein